MFSNKKIYLTILSCLFFLIALTGCPKTITPNPEDTTAPSVSLIVSDLKRDSMTFTTDFDGTSLNRTKKYLASCEGKDEDGGLEKIALGLVVILSCDDNSKEEFVDEKADKKRTHKSPIDSEGKVRTSLSSSLTLENSHWIGKKCKSGGISVGASGYRLTCEATNSAGGKKLLSYINRYID